MVRKRIYANILCGTDDKTHNLENQMLQQTTAKSFKTDEYRYIFFGFPIYWLWRLFKKGVMCSEFYIYIFICRNIYISWIKLWCIYFQLYWKIHVQWNHLRDWSLLWNLFRDRSLLRNPIKMLQFLFVQHITLARPHSVG